VLATVPLTDPTHMTAALGWRCCRDKESDVLINGLLLMWTSAMLGSELATHACASQRPHRNRRPHRGTGTRARRARQRQMAESAWCGRRFTHPRLPTQYDELGYLAVEICVCVRPSDHERECFCAHGVERFVYRVDRDGREHYATRPLIR
jgi:hypothetical protein